MLDAIATVIFPGLCVNCGKPVLFSERNICIDCLEKIEFISDGCSRCSGIVFDGECTVCKNRFFYPEKNIVIGEYSSVLKNIIAALKFNGCTGLASVIADLIVRKLEPEKTAFDIIIPVPMSGQKKWKRGYNQCELIAVELAKRMNIKSLSLLKEKKGSLTQRNLGYRDRFVNVLGRYELSKPEKIKGKEAFGLMVKTRKNNPNIASHNLKNI